MTCFGPKECSNITTCYNTVKIPAGYRTILPGEKLDVNSRWRPHMESQYQLIPPVMAGLGVTVLVASPRSFVISDGKAEMWILASECGNGEGDGGADNVEAGTPLMPFKTLNGAQELIRHMYEKPCGIIYQEVIRVVRRDPEAQAELDAALIGDEDVDEVDAWKGEPVPDSHMIDCKVVDVIGKPEINSIQPPYHIMAPREAQEEAMALSLSRLSRQHDGGLV